MTGFAQITDPIAVVQAMRQLSTLLISLGWQLLVASANLDTGFVRLVLEARDHRIGTGRQVLLHRSTYNSEVLFERNVVRMRRGFYTDAWAVVDTFGRSKIDIDNALAVALRHVLLYAVENNSDGALPVGACRRRGEALYERWASLRLEPGPVALHSLDGEALTEEWLDKCERTNCRGG
jgi:hypothetical protein